MISLADYANNLLKNIAKAQTGGGTIGRCDICGDEITSRTELDTGVCSDCCKYPDIDETGDNIKENKLIEQAEEMRKCEVDEKT